MAFLDDVTAVVTNRCVAPSTDDASFLPVSLQDTSSTSSRRVLRQQRFFCRQKLGRPFHTCGSRDLLTTLEKQQLNRKPTKRNSDSCSGARARRPCSADIPVCGFTGLSSPVLLKAATVPGVRPSPAATCTRRTRKREPNRSPRGAPTLPPSAPPGPSRVEGYCAQGWAHSRSGDHSGQLKLKTLHLRWPRTFIKCLPR